MQTEQRSPKVGYACAILAHTMWGFFPIYWPYLQPISSFSLVGHRVLWAFVILTLVVPLTMRNNPQINWRKLATILTTPRLLAMIVAAAMMLGVNWLSFIWAVTNGTVLQASLGYYINPLFSILLGVIVLRERLLTIQWLAVAVAGTGVVALTIAGGGLPWASLGMATAFALYGLFKKKAPLPSLPGLWVETAILLLPAVAYLMYVGNLSSVEGTPFSPSKWILLFGGGVITIVPLALFSVAAKSVPLSTIGVLQYIGPTLQFFVGVAWNGEKFGLGQAVGFAFVWIGSGLYLLSLGRSR